MQNQESTNQSLESLDESLDDQKFVNVNQVINDKPQIVQNQNEQEDAEIKNKAQIRKKPYENPQKFIQKVEYKVAEVNQLFQKQNLFNKEDNYDRQTILHNLEAFWNAKKEDLIDEKFTQLNRKQHQQDQNTETLLKYQQTLSKHIQNICGGDFVQPTYEIEQYSSQIMKLVNNFQQQSDQQEIMDEEHTKIQSLSQSLSNNRQDHQKIYFFRREYLDKQSANFIIQLIRNNIKQFYNTLIIENINQFYILNSNNDQDYQINDVQRSQIRQQILNFFSQVYSLHYESKEENLELFIIEIFKYHFRIQNPLKYIQIFDRNYLSLKQNVDFLYQIIQKQEIYQQFITPAIINKIEDFFLDINSEEKQNNYADHSTIEQIKDSISRFFQDNFQLKKPQLQKIEPQVKELTLSGQFNQQSTILSSNQSTQTLKEFVQEIFLRFFQYLNIVQKYQPINIKPSIKIRKLQNGNIIHSLENKSKLYCNYQFDHQLKILKRDGFNTEQVIYDGILDQYDQPHNYGVLENPQWKYEGEFHKGFFHGVGKFEYKGVYTIDGQFIDGNVEGEDCVQYFSKSDPYGKEFNIKGKFQRGLKQGSFQCSIPNCQQLAFDNDKQIEVQKPQSKSYPFREYGNVGIQFIDQKCFETTFDARWMQQKVVDFYLISLWSDLSLINDLNHIKLINTCSAQDIFGSVIRQNNLNFDEIKIQITNENKSFKRIIIALNMNQQHFMACVYENNKFYLLDSICGSYYPALQFNLNEIFKIKPHIQFQTQLKISYQPNGYDCGAYLCYYVHQLLRYPNTNIENIKFNDSHQYIGEFRKRIRNILLDNYDFTFK